MDQPSRKNRAAHYPLQSYNYQSLSSHQPTQATASDYLSQLSPLSNHFRTQELLHPHPETLVLQHEYPDLPPPPLPYHPPVPTVEWPDLPPPPNTLFQNNEHPHLPLAPALQPPSHRHSNYTFDHMGLPAFPRSVQSGLSTPRDQSTRLSTGIPLPSPGLGQTSSDSAGNYGFLSVTPTTSNIPLFGQAEPLQVPRRARQTSPIEAIAVGQAGPSSAHSAHRPARSSLRHPTQFLCTCGEGFGRSADRARHYRTKCPDNPNKKRYPCPNPGCDADFPRRDNVYKHLKCCRHQQPPGSLNPPNG